MRAHDELQVLALVEALGAVIPPRLALLASQETIAARRAAERAVSALGPTGATMCDGVFGKTFCCREVGHQGAHVTVLVWDDGGGE